MMSSATAMTRLAMWSGPRNISTAMMRAWENRADTFVTDEPFYAHYLHSTGIDHPGREQILASQSTDWREVVQQCTSQRQPGATVHYQKHMTQHLLAPVELDWIDSLINVFLIRSPEAVVSSYARTRPDVTPADLGFEQQHRLYQHVTTHLDPNPLIIAADDVLRDPRATLSAICARASLDFDENMLAWPAGKRDSDGVWAPHWYHNVEKSTGFGPYVEKTLQLNDAQKVIADQCRPFYQKMAAARFQLPD